MIQDRIAKRYAKSIIQIGKERGTEVALLDDMRALIDLCEKSHEFANFLASPILEASRKEDILKRILKEVVSEGTLTLAVLLARRHRESLLPFIAKEYVTLYNRSRNITTVLLQTSVEPDPAFVHAVTKEVEKHLKTNAELTVEVKPELIGGFVLLLNDRIIDASVMSSLRELKKQFQQNQYVSQL